MDANLAYQDDWTEKLRKEMHSGKVIMMSPAATNHVFIAGNLYYLFAKYLKGKPCTPIADGVTVFLTDLDAANADRSGAGRCGHTVPVQPV